MIGVDDTLDDATDQTAPVWAVFGDLMAGLLGAFVLILVGVLVVGPFARGSMMQLATATAACVVYLVLHLQAMPYSNISPIL